MLYLLEKVLIFLPEALSQRWQYHRSSLPHLYNVLLANSLTKYTLVLGVWWASCFTRGTAGSCWSARQCAFSSSGTLHLENRLATRSLYHNVLKINYFGISIILKANISKREHRCMQYLQPWCQASPLLTPTWGSLLWLLSPQSQVHFFPVYLCFWKGLCPVVQIDEQGNHGRGTKRRMGWQQILKGHFGGP